MKKGKQRKDEKNYLSERERERLTDAQKKYVVRKRKELGSWNDADLKESIRDKMTSVSDKKIKDFLDKLEPTEMLHKACEYGFIDYVKKAIDDGADTYNTFYDEEPSEDYYQMLSALDIAMENKQDDIVEYLLKNGYKSKYHIALNEYINYIVKNDNMKMIKLFVNNIRDNNNKLIKTAISNNKIDLVKYFIEDCNFDIDYGDGVYLNIACINSNVNIINYLFEKGITKKWGNTCLRLAIKNDNHDLIDTLLKNKVKPNRETLQLAKDKNRKLYYRLLKNKYLK